MTERQQGKRTEGGTFLFEFDATEDKRKAFPYACRFYLDGNGELEREFFDLDRDWVGRETVRVSGEYGAEPGDVIEECTHASWKNRYRYLYVISPGGEKVPARGIRPRSASISGASSPQPTWPTTTRTGRSSPAGVAGSSLPSASASPRR